MSPSTKVVPTAVQCFRAPTHSRGQIEGLASADRATGQAVLKDAMLTLYWFPNMPRSTANCCSWEFLAPFLSRTGEAGLT
jgi:hypothetical protein